MLEKEMNLLLENFWITKDSRREDYYLLKKNQKALREFIGKNLGNKLIVHDRFIKLEKIPAQAKSCLGVSHFSDTLDYVILFLFLLYLEDKTRGEKFILSSLIEYIKNTAITLELNHIPDWNYTANRKSLIRVLNFLQELQVITLKDDDHLSFQDTKDADALYEVTGISNYVLPAFDYEIYDCHRADDFLKKEWGEQLEDKGDVRRYKVYRHLLYSPVVTRDDLTDSEDDYLKKMHKTIEHEMATSVNMDVEITKNMAFTFASETSIQKDYFPNMKKISDIVLMLNQKIREYVEKEKITGDDFECFRLSKPIFFNIVNQLREEKREYFSRYYLDLNAVKYQEEVIAFMKDYHFIKEEERDILIYPITMHYLGKTKNKETRNQEQLALGEVEHVL